MNKTIQNLLIHLFFVFVISITITLIFWAILPAAYSQNEGTDYFDYYEPVARNIVNGSGIVLPDHQPAISNPPGYAIIIAGIFEFARLVALPESVVYSIITLIFMASSSIFVFLLARNIWGLPDAWISALFFMTYPFILWLTRQPVSEVPFMTAFYASVYLFWRGLKDKRHVLLNLFLSGGFAGIAMLIRGIAIGISFVSIVLLFLLKNQVPVKRRIFEGLILLLANLLVVLPWIFWTYQKTGQFIPLGSNGVSGINDGLTFAVESKGYRQKIEVPADVENLQNELAAENGSMYSLSTISQTVFDFFIREPVPVTKLFLLKMARSWYGTDSGTNEFAISVIQIFYGIFILIAILTVWLNRQNTPGLLLFVGVFVLYFWAMTTLVLSILRYMTPVMGMFALLMPGMFQKVIRRVFRST